MAVICVLTGLDEPSDMYGLLAKSAFSSKGFVISAEKASRNARICFSISGISHELAHASRSLMCLVKYAAAPL